MADYGSFDGKDFDELFLDIAFTVDMDAAEAECRVLADLFRVGLIQAIRSLLGYDDPSRGAGSANAGLITPDTVPLHRLVDDDALVAKVQEFNYNKNAIRFKYEIRFTSKMYYRPGLFRPGEMVSPARSDIIETLSYGFQEGPAGSGAVGYWGSRKRKAQAWAVREPNMIVRDYIVDFTEKYPMVSVYDPWGFSDFTSNW